MSYTQRILFIAVLITGFFCYGSVIAEITVEPFGFAVSVEEDDEAEIELVLGNSSEDDIAFKIEYELIVDEEDQQAGPRRDDPGDILRRYEIPYVHTIGLAWDPEQNWMWGLDWSVRRLYAIDVENGEIQVNIQLNQGMVGLFHHDGVIHAGSYNANRQIFRWDIEGNAIETWRLPITLADTHIGGDGEYIYTVAYQRGGGRGDVHVFDMENLAR